MPEHILVAVAWPYANGPRHIGHVAGFGVPSDIFARYHRLKGNYVLMVSGTDEHGTPITIAAEKEGVTPRQVADRYSQVIGDDLYNLGLSYDTFTRTTTLNHYHVTQDIFKTLYEKGYITRQETLGAFSATTGRTLPDRYIEGTCPLCGYHEARGDQCDNCGHQLDPIDLVNPRSKIDGQPPVFRETEHFFLDLPAFADRLSKWIAKQDHWRPNVRSFSLNFIKELKPRAITRDLEWGVPIPLPEYEQRDDKRIYVWFDAVIGYLSASIEWANNRGTPDAWRDWWQNRQARHFYFMGKDNIVFHTVIWPAQLMGVFSDGHYAGSAIGAFAEIPLQLPHNVVSSEFLTMEGKKFSSSRGVVIYVNDFLSRYDPDPLRYFLTIAGPENQDTDFTWAEFVRRNNDELVATWGNLVNRTLTNVYKNFGVVPTPGELTPADSALIATIDAGFTTCGELLEGARFKAALTETMRLAALVNSYLSDQEPWKVLKQDRERGATIWYVALRCVASLRILFTPFLPFSCQRLHTYLGYDGYLAGPLKFTEHNEANGMSHRVLTGDYTTWIGRWAIPDLPVGQQLREPQPLFKKLDERVVAEELARMEA
ncbi:MAG: methionine--tRNA ligase [Candidatus Viridilinea halotolerans]|uniref:Methionine--tRNA ligase n=1 Tax=Candidatus Viridilinea halotolerans TaxID=2491704 RepID=A0A426U154_9CHLR|nr:MAG: methionine--tRNA ligase [Candidatus Viridilinea halotolerans]